MGHTLKVMSHLLPNTRSWRFSSKSFTNLWWVNWLMLKKEVRYLIPDFLGNYGSLRDWTLYLQMALSSHIFRTTVCFSILKIKKKSASMLFMCLSFTWWQQLVRTNVKWSVVPHTFLCDHFTLSQNYPCVELWGPPPIPILALPNTCYMDCIT
jgi:hypothetical protein